MDMDRFLIDVKIKAEHKKLTC